MASAEMISCGYCLAPGAWAERGGAWAMRRFPARAWLIESAGGAWLFDTAYSRRFFRAARGWGRLYAAALPVRLPDFAAREFLSGRNLGPDDLRGLIISHFHADHIAGLLDFPQTPFIGSAEAWASVRGRRGPAALRRGFLPGLLPEDFESRYQALAADDLQTLPETLRPFELGWPLAGPEGDLWLLPLPGHAVGQIGAALRRPDSSWEFLAADAAWSPAAFRRGRLPVGPGRLAQADWPAYLATLEKLGELDRSGRAVIRLSHED